MDRTKVNRELREQFFPLLVAAGFTRKGDVARRRTADGVVHVVEVQHRARAGVFSVNLGAHLIDLGDVAGGAPVDADAMRDHDCAWRTSVVSGFRSASDSELTYGATVEEAAESVAFLVSEWPRQSEQFFGPLTSWPEDFSARVQDARASDRHPAHQLVWARVARLLGDEEAARAIAAAALPRVPERATALRDHLTAFAG